MSHQFGIIAEDLSDVDVIKALIHKIVPNFRFTTKHFIGHGCGKINGKCNQWAYNLKNRGCSALILIHDLDKNEIKKLHNQLTTALNGCPIKTNIIIIPVKEIESWLLSDEEAIQEAMNLISRVPRINEPEYIEDPKHKLKEIVYLKSGKTKHFINTKHNVRIAERISLNNIRRCNSFLPLEEFILAQIS